MIQHQYIERDSGRIVTEKLFGDRTVQLLYHHVRENAPGLFRLCTSSHASSILAFLNFDASLKPALQNRRRYLADQGIDLEECVELPDFFDTQRKVFERQIRYWSRRPMPDDPKAVVSPADCRILVGSFRETSMLFLKEKFFDFHELLGHDKEAWLSAFAGGDFAVCRLTPDKYHYNHVPVAGKVVDIYQIGGDFHSCNPEAVVQVATPFSKNRRVVTVIDTEVPGGTRVGLVAMIEVVALMIGDIVQCYSDEQYRRPKSVQSGMFLRKGAPKSLYRPGSSTDVLIFQAGRIDFAEDLVANMRNVNATSRFTAGFGRPLVETDIKVRSLVARPAKKAHLTLIERR